MWSGNQWYFIAGEKGDYEEATSQKHRKTVARLQSFYFIHVVGRIRTPYGKWF